MNILFPIADGISIAADTNFSITVSDLFNPPNETDCTTFTHYAKSYFGLSIIKSASALTHTSSPPTDSGDDNTPCVKYESTRADILPDFPNVVYAGLSYNFTLNISSPSKMLLVRLACTDSAVTFEPSKVYFNSYDVSSIQGKLVVSSMASNNTNAYINITHE